jgi:hypothetical protein
VGVRAADADEEVGDAAPPGTRRGGVIGRFGSAGKLTKQFGIANSIDCRNDPTLLVGEMTNWRVQKITLKR